MHTALTGPLTTERVTVPIRDLPLTRHGTTLVQLSDFHFDGQHLSPDLLRQAIARCNDIFPDLVLLTGDFVTQEATPIHALAQHLKDLRSRYGTYAILGNHDIKTEAGRHTITAALSQANVSVLWNAIAHPLGDALPLIGLADLRSGLCRPAPLLAKLPPWMPRIVLAHNPDVAEQLLPLRADLQLSGHTHGGQVVLPGLGPLPAIGRPIRSVLPSWLRQQLPYMGDDCSRTFQHWEWALGLHQLGQNQLYVNRGLGTYWPGRFLCPPELTVLTLVRA